MDINDTTFEATMLDEPPHPTRDPRRIAVCFAVCLLAATAVFLVARPNHDRRQVATAASTSTTTHHRRTPVTVGRAKPAEPSEIDEGDGYFEQLFGDRLDDLFGESTSPSEPADPSEPHASGSSGTEASGGETGSIEGRDFTVKHPNGWEAREQGDTYTVMSPDDASGVGISVTDAPPDGYRFEQWANEWEATAGDRLVSDLRVTDRGKFETDTMAGYRLHFTGTAGGEAVEGEMWWLGDGDTVWVLSQAYPAGDSPSRAACERVARSFRPATVS
jgi:hypothetical protein